MARSRRSNHPQPLPFNRKLVLHQWLLGLFGVERFDQLAEHLRDETLAGLDENNVHRFHHALCVHLPAEKRPELPDDLLLEHDQAVVSVTQRLNEQRLTRGEPPIVWKYFQYLSLLFTEIYLDRYFRDPRTLLVALNRRIETLNEGLEESDRIAPLDETSDAWPQLNKIAFWMATSSGKTGQAVKSNPELTNLYARITLFDYSYRWFYSDGFGKDYHILNLEDDSNAEWMASYLTACLLAFFQQQRLHREREAGARHHVLAEEPGGSQLVPEDPGDEVRIVFQDEDKGTYISAILKNVVATGP